MMKNKVLLTAVVVLLLSLVSAGCTSDVGGPSPSPPTSTYSSPKGFVITYPPDWVKDEAKSGPIAVFFDLPTGNAKESLNVQVWNRSANDTLENVTADILYGVQALPDYVQIEAGNATLGGVPSYRIVYTMTDDRDSLKVTEIWAIKGGKEYIITYEATPDNYNKYESTAQQMIDSFRIK
jgi:serine/threonine-protein kinase